MPPPPAAQSPGATLVDIGIPDLMDHIIETWLCLTRLRFVVPPYQEPRLFRFGAALEAVLAARRVPAFPE